MIKDKGSSLARLGVVPSMVNTCNPSCGHQELLPATIVVIANTQTLLLCLRALFELNLFL